MIITGVSAKYITEVKIYLPLVLVYSVVVFGLALKLAYSICKVKCKAVPVLKNTLCHTAYREVEAYL
jgi:hypothetical protein